MSQALSLLYSDVVQNRVTGFRPERGDPPDRPYGLCASASIDTGREGEMACSDGTLRVVWTVGILLLLRGTAWGAGALAVDRPPRIDGILVEWGAAEWVPIAPGGEDVGYRGGFDGPQDHEVDLYLMWDANFLYAAVAVVDDITDTGRIGPRDHVWKGPGGERKDAMFYYDHLKVFLRGPEAPLGFNVWVGPSDGEREPYAWGGRQRNQPLAGIPVHVGSAWKANIYTYELAFPWEWLGIHPQSGMELSAMFLLPDADLPGVELRKKVRQSNKWIWWKGEVQLVGKPPGLKPPPRSAVAEEIERQSQAIVVPEVRPREEPPEDAEKEVAQGEAAEVRSVVEEETGGTAETARETATGTASSAGNADSSAAPTVVSMSSLRARLNRELLARKRVLPAPDWVRALGRDAELTAPKVDSLFYRLTASLHRLAQSGINSRTDGLVMDIAEYAGTWRAQARAWLVALLDRLLTEVELEEGAVRAKIARAAEETGIEAEEGRQLVKSICDQSLSLYRENKVRTSGDLLKKARRQAGMSEDEVRIFIQALVADWAE